MSQDIPTDDDKEASARDESALIGEATKFLAKSASNDSKNRTAALDDLWFLQGDGQWPMASKALRTAEGRPCLTINTLPAMVHQVTNDLRQNKPGIKVHPVDDDASKQADMARLIGTSLPLKVIEINRHRNRLILSERQAVQERRDVMKERLIEELSEGEVRRGQAPRRRHPRGTRRS